MTYSEIKSDLEQGNNFGNEACGWYTVSRPHQDTLVIVFEEGKWARSKNCDYIAQYKDYRSYAKRVRQLIVKGF